MPFMNNATNKSVCQKKQRIEALDVSKALILYSNHLTEYERAEICRYREIFYVGHKSSKVRENYSEPNFGFDEPHEHRYITSANDHIAYRYQILRLLGQGSFGSVIAAHDHKRNCRVAIKIIRNQQHFHQQAKVELKMLTRLKPQASIFYIISLFEYFVFRNHVCFVFPLYSCTLYDHLRKNFQHGMPNNTTRIYTIKILHALLYLQKESIIHSDLKPENIMISSSNPMDIRVIDFGSACYDTEKMYTYIQSRFYRSPEVILLAPYSIPIDMWSLGCIVYELATGRHLFDGVNEYDQLACIMGCLGLPPRRLLEQSRHYKKHFRRTGCPRYCKLVKVNGEDVLEGEVNAKGKFRPAPACNKFMENISKREYGPRFIDFMLKCLEYVPSQRMTPSDAFYHDWLEYNFEAGSSVVNNLIRLFTPSYQSYYVKMNDGSQRLQRGRVCSTDEVPAELNSIGGGGNYLNLPQHHQQNASVYNIRRLNSIDEKKSAIYTKKVYNPTSMTSDTMLNSVPFSDNTNQEFAVNEPNQAALNNSVFRYDTSVKPFQYVTKMPSRTVTDITDCLQNEPCLMKGSVGEPIKFKTVTDRYGHVMVDIAQNKPQPGSEEQKAITCTNQLRRRI